MRRIDQRRNAVLLTLMLVAAGGVAIHAIDSPHAPVPAATPTAAPHADETQRLFNAAVVMLHAKRYDDAATALHRVLTYVPKMPEAHVNMGFAMLGLKRHKEARDFFEGATALAPKQANAYYGLALVHEAQGDLALATGAMRSYLHLARDERPEHLARARAALWEWEQQRAAASAPR
jgi:tetratricopeptide (TPR) repeat protein